MGASFRNRGEIIELAGCDRLTIAPKLLDELDRIEIKLERRLDDSKVKNMDIPKEKELDEKLFRWLMNEDPMATEKLSDGIRKFAKDTEECEKLIKEMLAKSG